MKTRILIALFVLSLAADCVWIRGPFDWRMLLAAFVAWYLADFGSGLIHMVMDYIPCRPGVGLADIFFYPGSRESEDYLRLRDAVWRRINLLERVAYDFKNHHPRPDALGRRDIVFLVWSTVLFITLPVSVAFNLYCLAFHPPGWLVVGFVVLLAGGTLSQWFHGSLHRKTNPAFVPVMRRLGLLITPAAHQIHHDTLTRDFSVINGWSNPVLNVVFRLLMKHRVLTPAGLEPT
jgi:hypothetical protein